MHHICFHWSHVGNGMRDTEESESEKLFSFHSWMKALIDNNLIPFLTAPGYISNPGLMDIGFILAMDSDQISNSTVRSVRKLCWRVLLGWVGFWTGAIERNDWWREPLERKNRKRYWNSEKSTECTPISTWSGPLQGKFFLAANCSQEQKTKVILSYHKWFLFIISF